MRYKPEEVIKASESANSSASVEEAFPLSPSELLLAPTQTLGKINEAMDRFASRLLERSKDKSDTFLLKDIRALSDLVKANAALRQTQLAEDAAARASHAVASDEDIATMLVQALAAGGPKALIQFEKAMKQLEAAQPQREPNELLK